MSETKKIRHTMRLIVRRTERLTPHMLRVVFGGEGLAEFVPNDFTDSYVKLLFPKSEVDYPKPFDYNLIQESMPRALWPDKRTYTVRHCDKQAGELAIDFVYHGPEGIAGPWAMAAQPGDELHILGPGGAYAPLPTVDWHLLVGDESALPAIGVAVEALPPSVPARVILQVEDATEEQPLLTKGDIQVTWLHRSKGETDIVTAVRNVHFAPGKAQAFVHGEAGFVKELRQHLLRERGIDKDLLSISGYWRRGKNEDGWQAEKAAERARTTAAA